MRHEGRLETSVLLFILRSVRAAYKWLNDHADHPGCLAELGRLAPDDAVFLNVEEESTERAHVDDS